MSPARIPTRFGAAAFDTRASHVEPGWRADMVLRRAGAGAVQEQVRGVRGGAGVVVGSRHPAVYLSLFFRITYRMNELTPANLKLGST